jgi:aspartate/methionine/tyrosine aminotransferase
VRLAPIPYMRWAKAHLQDEDKHNLGNSGIRHLLDPEDLGWRDPTLPLFGHNDDGWPPLMAAIAARFGVEDEQVIAAEGTSLANFLALAAWIRPGDPVLLEEPYYEPLGSVLAALDARVRPVPVDGGAGHASLLSTLRSARGTRWRAVVITLPHNPTGRLVTEEELDELDRHCAREGALLFVDEAYREVLFEEPPGCAARGRTATVATSSLTKAFGLSALRVGWAIGPPSLIAHARALHDNLGVVHPLVTEALGARLLADTGRMKGFRDRLRERIGANRAVLDGFLARHPKRFVGAPPGHGILAFPRWNGEGTGLADAETLCRRAMEAGIVLVPGRFFQRPDHVRLGVGGRPEEVARSIEAFEAFLEREGAA